jgi:hypothetical protein
MKKKRSKPKKNSGKLIRTNHKSDGSSLGIWHGIIIGIIVGVSAPLLTQYIMKLIETPDYRISAEIKAPLVKVETLLINRETDEKISLPDGQGLNPIEVLVTNTGKKPIEKVEIILEFLATGDFQLFDEKCYPIKPERGFEKIDISAPNKTERRVKLDLFNPGDEFLYLATGTRPVRAIAYTRFPGLSFYQEYKPGSITK